MDKRHDNPVRECRGCGRNTFGLLCPWCQLEEETVGKTPKTPEPADRMPVHTAHDDPMPEDEAADLADYRRYRAHIPYEDQVIQHSDPLLGMEKK